jgi:prevent-host-death family protein
MKYSAQVKPISYFKNHAAEVVRELAQGGEPYILTLNGEAKAVVQGMHSFEQTQQTLALLKLLALGNKQIDAGDTRTLDQAVSGLRQLGSKE